MCVKTQINVIFIIYFDEFNTETITKCIDNE